jgi:hypothetical protein
MQALSVEDARGTAEEYATVKNAKERRAASGAHIWGCDYVRDELGPCTCWILLQEKYPSKREDELESAYREAYDPDWGGE